MTLKHVINQEGGKYRYIFGLERPGEKETDVSLDGGALYSPAAFATWLGSNHISVGLKDAPLMQDFTTHYIKRLQAHMPSTVSYDGFGWRGESHNQFIVGTNLLSAGSDDILEIKVNDRVSGVAAHIKPAGSDLNEWKKIARLFTASDMPAHAFGFAAGFGAPLMEFLPEKGTVLSLVRGTVVEAKLDNGRGPVATLLVQSGTLKVGDALLSGAHVGKVRALIDDTGKRIESAGPSTPVEVIGFSEVPAAGDIFTVTEDEKKARQIALSRFQKQRSLDIAKAKKLTLDELYTKIKEGQIKELNIIIKGDVQGSVEAIKDAFENITHAEVKVRVIHTSVGGITESDVMLATASNAIIIGFNVRPEAKASQTAEKEGVDIRLYNVLYEAIEDVKKALEGLLEPTFKEKVGPSNL